MNPYFIAGGVIAVVLAYGIGHWQGDDAGQSKIQVQWDQEKAKLANEYAANVEAMRQKEQSMAEASAEIMERKNHELREINARATALSNSLRQRPTRTESSSVPSTTASCSGVSGKELARGDAEFLAGYSADAAKLQAALNQCIEQYESIRK